MSLTTMCVYVPYNNYYNCYNYNNYSGEGEVFVDPFNKGQILSQSDCLNLIPFLPVTSPEVFNAVPTYKVHTIYIIYNIYYTHTIHIQGTHYIHYIYIYI